MRIIDTRCSTSVKFCIFFIIFNVTHVGRTLAKHTQSTQVSMSTQKMETLSRLELLKMFRSNTKNCIEHSKDTTWNCVKISTLRAFDELTASAVIPIGNGVRFIASKENPQNSEIKDDASFQRQDIQHMTFFDLLSMRLAKILHTHILQLNFTQMTDTYMRGLEQNEARQGLKSDESVGRHRRQRFNTMITMLFGFFGLGAVLIPMGFQLLSIVSGKALLLAKMALLLASINGLKRVANSGVHYGLYQVPGEYNGYYDRNSLQQPRTVENVANAQIVEYGIRK